MLVADAGLGTINAVRLTLEALGPLAKSAVVVLNRFDDHPISTVATSNGCATGMDTAPRSRSRCRTRGNPATLTVT